MGFAVPGETDDGLWLASYFCLTNQIWLCELFAGNQLLLFRLGSRESAANSQLTTLNNPLSAFRTYSFTTSISLSSTLLQALRRQAEIHHRTAMSSSVLICACRRMVCKVLGASARCAGTVTRSDPRARRICEPSCLHVTFNFEGQGIHCNSAPQKFAERTWL